MFLRNLLEFNFICVGNEWEDKIIFLNRRRYVFIIRVYLLLKFFMNLEYFYVKGYFGMVEIILIG